jgi:Arc-like DNA binding domain
MPNRIEKVSINLRLPRDLHEKLVEAGSSRLPPVSLNSEILRRLLKTFEPPSAVDYDKEMFRLFGEKRIRKLEGRVEELTQRMEKPDRISGSDARRKKPNDSR